MKLPLDAFNFQLAVIRPVNAREYFAQGAFARAVFAHDRVAASGGHLETDVLERDRSRKPFADATETNGGNGSLGAQKNRLQRFSLWIRRRRQYPGLRRRLKRINRDGNAFPAGVRLDG